jgi:hypothetical protein
MLPRVAVLKLHKLKLTTGWVSVAHACNPSYSGGNTQEDQVQSQTQANTFREPISKKPFTKKGLVEWLK